MPRYTRPGVMSHAISRPIFAFLIALMGTWVACGECLADADAPRERYAPSADANEYGIDCSTYQVMRHVLKRNQNLSKILLARNVPYGVIDELARKSKDVFDIRRLKAGNPYCIVSEPGPMTEEARYLIYEQNPVDYVVFKLADPVDVYRGKKEVATRTVAVGGIVESSLWNTVNAAQVGFDLATQLSELYAWAVDFHHLQKGDRFKVLFEEKYVHDTRVGTGDIIGAVLSHGGRDFYAFRFQHDSGFGYYDEHGASMRKAFLKAPVRFSRITSRYSPRRLHPVLGVYKAHLGTDYAAPRGTPIVSIGDGIIDTVGYDRECGKYVKVRHNGTYTTQYLHMSRAAKGLRRGMRVKQGDVIGYVGSTGLATGPHVDLRVWKHGRLVDLFNEELPATDPLGDHYRESFESRMKKIKQRLDTITFVNPTA